MPERILITGGSGLIGRNLTDVLLKNGFEVAWISRSTANERVKIYQWDLDKGTIDSEAVEWADHVIHLAGANVFEEKWSKQGKKQIIESRTKSTQILYNAIEACQSKPRTFISASAIGYYGVDTKDQIITEQSSKGNDFLAEVVDKWEASADALTELGLRVLKLRIGVALSGEGGALAKMVDAVRKGIAAPLGSGKQFISWVHINDVAGTFIKAIQDNNMSGVYNVVAPEPVTNEEMTKVLGKVMGKSIIMPNVPAFALKIMFGSEKAEVVLGGSKVSSEKLQKAGYEFQFNDIETALSDLLSSGTK